MSFIPVTRMQRAAMLRESGRVAVAILGSASDSREEQARV